MNRALDTRLQRQNASIYSISGNQVYNEAFTQSRNTFRADIRSLSNGTYIVKVVNVKGIVGAQAFVKTGKTN